MTHISVYVRTFMPVKRLEVLPPELKFICYRL